VRVGQTIRRPDGRAVGASISEPTLRFQSGRETEFEVLLPRPGLAPGHYYLSMSIGFGDNSSGLVDLDVVHDSVHFEVMPPITPSGRVSSWHESWGSVRFASPRIVLQNTTVNV
jgi:hypothetical protein